MHHVALLDDALGEQPRDLGFQVPAILPAAEHPARRADRRASATPTRSGHLRRAGAH
jgi:hypothetical protein